MEGQTKPGLHKAADGTSTYFHPQQYELRKSEHKLFLLAQWLGHQPLTQNSCLYFLVCVSLGYCEKLLRDAGRMSMRMTLKHLRWVIMGAISVMKTEMGHIQAAHRRKPLPQHRRDGTCMITAAPQKQDPAEDDGLNLSLNSTWGAFWDKQTLCICRNTGKGRLDSA